jgi:hypothetical protein
MTIYVTDSFSLTAIDRNTQHSPRSGSWDDTIVRGTRVPVPITVEHARKIVSYSDNRIAVITSDKVASVLSEALGIELERKSIDIRLKPKDVMLIGLGVSSEGLIDRNPIEWWMI